MPWMPLCFALLLMGSIQPAQSDPVAEFRALAQSLAAAYLRGDRAFVDAHLADDWTSTDYLGRTWTKANVLAMFDRGAPPMTRAEIEVDRVRLHGDVAIVTGRSVSAGRVDGRDVTVTQRYTDVYVKQGGRWRVVASHGTEMK